MKIAIIDIGWKKLSLNSLETEALGGSESWLMQVSKEFAKNNQVDVYCWTDKEESSGNLRMIPTYNIIDKFVSRPRYDFIILNRIIHRYQTDFIGLIRQYNVTDNIYIQLHDLSLLYEDHLATEQELKKSCIFDPRVRGFVFLTHWHMTNFYAQYPFLNSIPYTIIPNGVDQTLIPTKKEKTDHRILWSSCVERGLEIFVQDVYPLIRKEILDFGIDVAGYSDLSKIAVRDLDVKILGNLTKKELYEEMNKHAAWFYPGIFAETFCITAVENMLCRNVVVSPFTYGTQFLLPPNLLNNVRMKYNFLDRNSEEYVKACKEAAMRIVFAIKNYQACTDLDERRVYCKQYTWKNTVKKYLDHYNKIYYNHIPATPEKTFKGIFLSQSSNIEFFRKESEVIEETWAKALIEGKHPGYTYFRYTACDEQHPEPCIDGYVIYIKNDDTFSHTYEKMRDAYRLLLELGYKFEKIFRTNTSTYVNVELAIKEIESCHPREIKSDICGYYHLRPDGSRDFWFNTFIGYGYIMSRKIADRIFLSRFDSTFNKETCDGDDIISTIILNELTDPGEVMYTRISNTGNEHLNMCRRYKTVPEKIADDDYENKARYTDDSNVVTKDVLVNVRVKSLDYKVRLEHGEYKHLRELHKAYLENQKEESIN